MTVTKNHSFFPTLKAGRRAGLSVAAILMASMLSFGGAFSPSAAAQVTGSTTPSTDANGQPQETVTMSAPLNGTKKEKEGKVVQTKDTKQQLRKTKKTAPMLGLDSKLPDKQLYDKATEQTKKGHYDVARLDLQTLLNTYPDSQYQMRSKLAIADSWYKEGGTAALTQAEAEYADFRVFFPNAPEAAEAQMRIGDIYFRQMDKPDRDYAKAVHAQEEYRRMLTDYPESTLVPDAKQRLREVQEVMATRESEIGAFYSTHANWPATIARFQTVVDSYPQYSHMDDVLVGLGDAYEAEARYVRTLKLPEAGKARLEKNYDDLAAAAYRTVVTESMLHRPTSRMLATGWRR
jgi:outer membrane protein assembly factor BamD